MLLLLMIERGITMKMYVFEYQEGMKMQEIDNYLIKIV
ncbi:hypothetical protein SAMN05216463_10854 [Xylanibacter ruminicola]|uniref:Uncharacterized protein n=1 Tax=Xylanibacter ruminicola TaxID=839 RepID=A0A1M6U6T0_XYLRU|nr:hypothetical protein SAMN05216463_10854 [Xylanibacter ruminicola]